MDIGIISMRYGKALLNYAKENGAEDVLYDEFMRLARSFSEFPELRNTLDNPILTRNQKLELLATAANGDKPVSPEYTNFMKLVLKNRREVFLQYIAMTYITLYRKLKHIAVGFLVTAVPVNKETEERIRNKAAAAVHADMELYTVVDPAIEGGFVFDINDYRLDASVATQLKQVKQQFIEKNKRIV